MGHCRDVIKLNQQSGIKQIIINNSFEKRNHSNLEKCRVVHGG